MTHQRIPRPGLRESFTLVLLAIFVGLPLLAFFIDDFGRAMVAFVYLALFFWFPVGQIIYFVIRDRKAGKPWEWPRIVGGPGIHINRDRL